VSTISYIRLVFRPRIIGSCKRDQAQLWLQEKEEEEEEEEESSVFQQQVMSSICQ
jgi:hypothetical protein